MRPATGLANLRQIASLGYGRKLVAPELVDALRAYVGFDICSLVWVDEQCRPTDFFAGQLRRPDLHKLYLSQYFGKLERVAMRTSSALLNSGLKFDTAQEFGKRYYGSEFFELICRPVDLHHALRIAVRDGNRPVAVMVLGRPPGSRNFSRADCTHVESALPYLAHALSLPDRVFQEEAVPSGESGIVIANHEGKIQFLSPAAENLLRMAALPSGLTNGADPDFYSAAKALLLPLLTRIRAATHAIAEQVPATMVANAWGQFTLRAYTLAPATGEMADLVGVTVTRFVPLPLKLLALAEVQALPRREKEVCLLLVQGAQVQEIAQRLKLSPHTVTTYIRCLYQHLNLSGRSELVAHLMRSATLDAATEHARHALH
jgi:DNA-binding CsgD family transcriptional regulator